MTVNIMKPLHPVPPATRIALGISFFVVFFAVWAAATFGGLVPKQFLADPVTMVVSGWTLLTQHGFAKDIGMTVWRVFGGFLIAAALAVPLGGPSHGEVAAALVMLYWAPVAMVLIAVGIAAVRYVPPLLRTRQV